jgi:hypothetical protein
MINSRFLSTTRPIGAPSHLVCPQAATAIASVKTEGKASYHRPVVEIHDSQGIALGS